MRSPVTSRVHAGVHYDQTTGHEWVFVHVRATRPLQAFHGACFVSTQLIRFMSALPLPRSLYFWFHDYTEPRLRRWCEACPHPTYQAVYNAAPAPARVALIGLADLLTAFSVGTRWNH